MSAALRVEVDASDLIAIRLLAVDVAAAARSTCTVTDLIRRLARLDADARAVVLDALARTRT